MKRTAAIQWFIGLFIAPLLISCLVLPPRQARAEDGIAETSRAYSREELAQMLAPIALYPDALLSQILMASTYPIEVIEADRWTRSNPGLNDDALDAALLDKDWDPSVKAVCHFPSILALMSDRISETTEIGNAFLAQESDVMDTVQELRGRAYAQGNLTTDSRRKVVVEKETIIIEPAAPRIVYVPYYDPFLVYGPWWYPAYPPWYWGPSGVSIGFGISYWPAFHFSFSYGSWSYFDWPRRTIFIDVHHRPRFVRHDRWIVKPGPWHHAPVHRRGFAYRDEFTARKYGHDSFRYRNYGRNIPGSPGGRDLRRNGDRRIDTRSRIDGNRRGDDRLRNERNEHTGQVRQRTVPERQIRERAGSVHQNRQLTVPNGQVREKGERERPQQVRQQKTKQEQVTLGRIREEGGRKTRDNQLRQPAAPEIKEEVQVERKGLQGSPGNVYNRGENGDRERASIERGRAGGQVRDDASRGRGRSGGDDWGGRGDRGRDSR